MNDIEIILDGTSSVFNASGMANIKKLSLHDCIDSSRDRSDAAPFWNKLAMVRSSGTGSDGQIQSRTNRRNRSVGPRVKDMVSFKRIRLLHEMERLCRSLN